MTTEELQKQELDKWFADNGDLTHRLNYDELTPLSFVMDIGGYHGQWSSNIYAKYNCSVTIFEPVRKYFQFIQSRFDKNGKINARHFGFSNKEKIDVIRISGDASSVFLDCKKADDLEIIKLFPLEEYIKELDYIALIKINAEGAEYDLLESLSTESLKKIKNLQVQFHTFMPNCEERRNAIRAKLSQTHECTWNYEFVWENWKLK